MHSLIPLLLLVPLTYATCTRDQSTWTDAQACGWPDQGTGGKPFLWTCPRNGIRYYTDPGAEHPDPKLAGNCMEAPHVFSSADWTACCDKDGLPPPPFHYEWCDSGSQGDHACDGAGFATLCCYNLWNPRAGDPWLEYYFKNCKITERPLGKLPDGTNACGPKDKAGKTTGTVKCAYRI